MNRLERLKSAICSGDRNVRSTSRARISAWVKSGGGQPRTGAATDAAADGLAALVREVLAFDAGAADWVERSSSILPSENFTALTMVRPGFTSLASALLTLSM